MSDVCEWCEGSGCDECAIATTTNVTAAICEWCEGTGCDECATAAPPATSTAMTNTDHPTFSPQTDCEWCEGVGCDECIDKLSTLRQHAQGTTKTDCEWCDGSGCDECACQTTTPTSAIPVQLTSVSNTSFEVAMDLNYEDDDSHWYDSPSVIMEDSISQKVLNLYHSAQYLGLTQQLPILAQIEDIANDEHSSFPITCCSQEELGAYVRALTLLPLLRLKATTYTPNNPNYHHFSHNIIAQSFSLAVKAHQQSPHHSDILAATVGEMLQIAAVADSNTTQNIEIFEDSKNPKITENISWSEFLTNMLGNYREHFPQLYLPVMKHSLVQLWGEYNTFTTSFSSKNHTGCEFQPLMAKIHALLAMCGFQGANDCVTNEECEKLTPISQKLLSSFSRSYDFKNYHDYDFYFSNILSDESIENSSNILYSPYFNQTSPISPTFANSIIIDSIDPLYYPTAFETILLLGAIHQSLDNSEFIISTILPALHHISSTGPFRPSTPVPKTLAVQARILDLFAYIYSTKNYHQQAYILYYNSFLRYLEASGLREPATVALCMSTLSCSLARAAVTVNPLLTSAAAPFLSSSHIGISGVRDIAMGLHKRDSTLFLAGAAQWENFCKLFHQRHGLRLAYKLPTVLADALILNQIAQTHTKLSIPQFLADYDLVKLPLVEKKEELLKNTDSLDHFPQNHAVSSGNYYQHTHYLRLDPRFPALLDHIYQLLSNTSLNSCQQHSPRTCLLGHVDETSLNLTLVSKRPGMRLSTTREEDYEESELFQNHLFHLLFNDSPSFSSSFFTPLATLMLPHCGGSTLIPHNSYFPTNPTTSSQILPLTASPAHSVTRNLSWFVQFCVPWRRAGIDCLSDLFPKRNKSGQSHMSPGDSLGNTSFSVPISACDMTLPNYGQKQHTSYIVSSTTIPISSESTLVQSAQYSTLLQRYLFNEFFSIYDQNNDILSLYNQHSKITRKKIMKNEHSDPSLPVVYDNNLLPQFHVLHPQSVDIDWKLEKKLFFNNTLIPSRSLHTSAIFSTLVPASHHDAVAHTQRVYLQYLSYAVLAPKFMRYSHDIAHASLMLNYITQIHVQKKKKQAESKTFSTPLKTVFGIDSWLSTMPQMDGDNLTNNGSHLGKRRVGHGKDIDNTME